ncbi:murein transglycosylase A [Yersinia pestis]|uniref:Membrane-bound lytic murein transglycosylase A n=17 Tax=Yersinia pseudotuberculosis complex TaxID=1649845 RepID=Q0WI20_YERPE|nr:MULTISPECIES: murein transglycosylase A [Yersinia pseudotuberculosis complex]CQD52453.1 murein transglycosylase A [Yersinia intermedia]AAM86709.1 membrane-bound lytic murein transglycosylase A [Yersinia pestis KIM10+]AAS63010.1 membrane-bound lytic murein transglycosylase A precursor [Yersinia pestis biovar Microtus str. 91001]ABG12464.1 membrane-bound lytic murein transglycosylase A precursor [Yersinia pestis Antiqua]ABG19304.1 membrane-bound lytic murein transglycosylase A precursor [Yers
MTSRWGKYLLSGIMIAVLAGCQSRPTDRGQQYKDGRLEQSLELVNEPNAAGKPVNAKDYSDQVKVINQSSPGLYNRNSDTFNAVQNWMLAGADTSKLSLFGLNAYQMEGVDNFGNVQFTGYYTPVLQARYTPQGEFRHPLYRMPAKGKRRLPDRAAIYAGALDNRNLIIAYTNSLVDNFMMEVQGSGYVDYGDGRPLTFFGYAGKNGHAYRSIGKVLIDRGEVARADMSMQAIRQWAENHSEAEVRELLEQNPSFVFFKPVMYAPVKGASAVPLIAKASVASDKSLIPPGTTLLAEVPLLDDQGKFTGKYQMRLMVALDVGGAIKGQHFDIYQGIGHEAGQAAGFYNHYGRVWVLKNAQSSGPLFTAYKGGTQSEPTSNDSSLLVNNQDR